MESKLERFVRQSSVDDKRESKDQSVSDIIRDGSIENRASPLKRAMSESYDKIAAKFRDNVRRMELRDGYENHQAIFRECEYQSVIVHTTFICHLLRPSVLTIICSLFTPHSPSPPTIFKHTHTHTKMTEMVMGIYPA